MNTRQRHPQLAALGLLALCAFAACGPSGDRPAAARRYLSIGTAPVGGAFFVVGGALAEVANQAGGDGRGEAGRGEAGWQVTAEATKGSRENIRRLATGELDFALSNAAITYFAVRGESGWDRAHEVRAVMTLAPNVALFVTPQDSGIETIADLRGRRVVVGPAGAGFEMFVGPLVEAHGVSYDDFTPLHNTQAAAVDMLADGSADAAFLGGAVPTASIVRASSSLEVRFVPFDPEAKAEALARYPFFAPATIPAGTYRGQSEEYAGLNVGSMHLITAAGADEELVYAFTKTIYENRDGVVERHAAGRAIQPQVVVRDTGTPFHPGAVRYYREIGIWPEGDVPSPEGDI